MAVMLAPTAMIGAWFGAVRAHRWPVRAIRGAFGLLLAISIIELFDKGWGQLYGGAVGH
jgi:uncharacterized membrane protein YfcA